MHWSMAVACRSNGICCRKGQASDCHEVEGLIGAVPDGATFLADKAQDSHAIRTRINAQGGFANIPTKRNRRHSFAFSAFLYRYRNLIERFFAKLINATGLANRYHKRDNTFLAAIKRLSKTLSNDNKQTVE